MLRGVRDAHGSQPALARVARRRRCSTWAVAGRDRTRLEQLAASLAGGSSADNAPQVVVANVNAPDSLLEMAQCVAIRARDAWWRLAPHGPWPINSCTALRNLARRFFNCPCASSTSVPLCRSCRVLLNCVGPFRHWGEDVVKACVAAGTDYLDVCGEPGTAALMRLRTNTHLCTNLERPPPALAATAQSSSSEWSFCTTRRPAPSASTWPVRSASTRCRATWALL